MQLLPSPIPDVLLIAPKIFGDSRGFFMESFNLRSFTNLTNLTNLAPTFVQDNHSRSTKGVLRGLHYQLQNPQGKLLRVIAGEIFDVALDLRRSSPTFGKHAAFRLSAENHHQLYVPPGFAHGFLVLSDSADVLYKTTDYYAPQHERTILWNDPALHIEWPLAGITPTLSDKDKTGTPFANAPTYE